MCAQFHIKGSFAPKINSCQSNCALASRRSSKLVIMTVSISKLFRKSRLFNRIGPFLTKLSKQADLHMLDKPFGIRKCRRIFELSQKFSPHEAKEDFGPRSTKWVFLESEALYVLKRKISFRFVKAEFLQ